MANKIPTDEQCLEWKKDKTRNPLTTYKIAKYGKVYKFLENQCKHIQSPENTQEIINETEKFGEITREICIEWLKDRTKNPLTNHIIKSTAKKYKLFENAAIYYGLIHAKTKEIIKKNIFNKDFNKDINKEIKITKNPKRKLKRQPTEAECLEWKKNKLRNPLTKTKTKIIEGDEIYKELENACKGFNTPHINEIKHKHNKLFKINENEMDENEMDKNEIDKNEMDKNEMDKNEMDKNEMDEYYPDLEDDNFNEKLLSLKEFRIYKIDKYNDINNLIDFENKSKELCKGFEKSSFQYLIAQYLSYRTPYKSLLLYYSVGVGKTCSAITIAESLLVNHNSYDEPMIWVILPSAIEAGFKSQIFEMIKLNDFSTISNQCTGDTYVKLAQITNETDKNVAEKKIKQIIKSRYRFFTYDNFATYIENYNKNISDKVIIVDEAHNIRSTNIEDKDNLNIDSKNNVDNKRVYNALIKVCKTGFNNKLILLTATPMYNEPKDIYNLFYLLLLNDKRESLYENIINEDIFDKNNNLNEESKKFIIKMSSNYISYLRGNNPFNFAFKLSPKLSNYKILDKIMPNTQNGKEIPIADINWLNNISDGIITSPLSDKQIEYMDEDKNQNNFGALQAMNIVYNKTIGKQGFNNFFINEGTKEQISLRYNKQYNNALIPDKEHLGLYSGKLLNIVNIISKSKGIIIIYSRFKWSGIIPLAIILEHMGFSRYGSDNLLATPNITHDIKYDNIQYPKYCILSSNDQEIMGNSKISVLVDKINEPENMYGENIKVVLITQVASEGLNFKNVREIHIMDAWFHFNKIDQIIGRGIRNCSHKLLPIEERNVTIFQHASINGYNKETADINAYRISSHKLYQTQLIDELIKNSAIDCSLFKNINYFENEMFKLGEINIITSQNINIKYKLGDNKDLEPKCLIDVDKIKENNIGFREETYKHLAINIQNKLKLLVLNLIHKNERFLDYDKIKYNFKDVSKKIIMHAIQISIYPNTIIDNILLIPHQNGLHIIDVIEDKPLKVNIEKIIDKNINNEDINYDKEFYDKIDQIKLNKYEEAVINLYLSLDENTFKLIINNIFKESTLYSVNNFMEECFVKEGILILKSELPMINGEHDRYIGFINIFNTEFEPLIYNKDGINHKNINDKQLKILKDNRILIKKPVDLNKEKLPYGLILPKYENKDKINKINVFKLLTPGIISADKTGMVCTSFKKDMHEKILNDLGINNKSEKLNKYIYCNRIANELYKIKRILILPEYKPK